MAKKRTEAATATNPGGDDLSAVQTGGGNGGGMVTVAYNSARSILFPVGGRQVLIKGSAAHLAGKEKGVIPVGRYGYTRISGDDWEFIQKTYGSMDIFKSGLLFAEGSRDRAEDRAEEQAELRHGLEPVDVKKTGSTEAKEDAGA